MAPFLLLDEASNSSNSSTSSTEQRLDEKTSATLCAFLYSQTSHDQESEALTKSTESTSTTSVEEEQVKVSSHQALNSFYYGTTNQRRGILRRAPNVPSHWPTLDPNSMKDTTALHLSVHFPEESSIVTAIYTRPRTHILDVPAFYYSEQEIRYFKRKYKREKQKSDRNSVGWNYGEDGLDESLCSRVAVCINEDTDKILNNTRTSSYVELGSNSYCSDVDYEESCSSSNSDRGCIKVIPQSASTYSNSKTLPASSIAVTDAYTVAREALSRLNVMNRGSTRSLSSNGINTTAAADGKEGDGTQLDSGDEVNGTAPSHWIHI